MISFVEQFKCRRSWISSGLYLTAMDFQPINLPTRKQKYTPVKNSNENTDEHYNKHSPSWLQVAFLGLSCTVAPDLTAFHEFLSSVQPVIGKFRAAILQPTLLDAKIDDLVHILFVCVRRLCRKKCSKWMRLTVTRSLSAQG